MKRTVLVFGLISGVLASLMMTMTLPLDNRIGADKAEFLGYTILVLASLLVFFGIRSYRDNAGAGQITFARAFGIGISITMIACVCYVVTWEVIYFNFLHGFMDKYFAHKIDVAQASGASTAAIQAKVQELRKYKELYENIWFNAALTFLEPFPVCLVVTVISSAILRKGRDEGTSVAALPAS
jgi:hypothetical protein